MPHEPVVISNGLTRRFGDTVAVNNLSLEVFHGEVFGLLGHNGAGKTTTVRLINGVLAASAGTVSVFGLSPITEGEAVRQRTGVLTETPSLYEGLTARDNLTIYANLYGVAPDAIAGRVQSVLETFELADRANEKVGGYSKGMKQRLALSRALLHEPDILFLDEPTAGLDPVAARGVNDLILHLSQDEGRTVFLCTHNLTEAQRLCDRVAVMEHGQLVAIGTPAELAAHFAGAQRVMFTVDKDQTGAASETLGRLDSITISTEKDVITATGLAHPMIPDALTALVQAGVRVYRVEPDEPSLEDVYFAIHGQEGNRS